MHAAFPFVVVLEGIDGAGKSSQCSRVADALSDAGLRVATPTSNATRPLRAVYKSLIDEAEGFPDARTSVLLGLADYAYAVQLAAEAHADVILLDRYAFSSCADALALGMRFDAVTALLSLFEPPDLTLFIDVSPREALTRKRGECSLAEAGGPYFAQDGQPLAESFLDYQSAVRDGFLRLIAAHHGPSGYRVIAGEDPLEDVTGRLTQAVMDELAARHESAAVGA